MPAGLVSLSTVVHLFQTICIISLSSTKSKRTNFTEYLTIDMRVQAQRFYVYLITNLINELADTLSATLTSWHQASWKVSVHRRVKHTHLLLHFPRMVRDRHNFRQTVITFKLQPEGSSFWGNRTNSLHSAHRSHTSEIHQKQEHRMIQIYLITIHSPSTY